MTYKQEQITPYGNEGSKREQVEQMFDNIAHSYDTLNHTLSFGIDHQWRKAAMRHLLHSGHHIDSVLDIATGTGDFALLAHRMLHPQHIVGCDISQGMMDIGTEKVKKAGLADTISFQYEDCGQMSFDDNSFDAVISAFALRNFQSLDQCLAEMYRVTKPGGQLAVVDLCTPVTFPMKQLFYIYKKVVMPALGRFVSHDSTAYSYLPQTMDAVPQAEVMQAIIAKAGFANTAFRRLPFGMCILYTGEKE